MSGGLPSAVPLLKDNQVTSPRSCLERLVILILIERPLLLILLFKPELHIRIILGVQYVTTSFTCAIPKDRTLIAIEKIHLSREPPHGIGGQVRVSDIPLRRDPHSCRAIRVPSKNGALTTTGPGNSRTPAATATYNMVAVAKLTISTLFLVHPFMKLHFLPPVNAWNMIAARAASLGLGRIVLPLLH